MHNYTAISLKHDDIHFMAKDDTEARHWVINHLDLSLNWTVVKTYKQ